jgi:hypothetical protein
MQMRNRQTLIIITVIFSLFGLIIFAFAAYSSQPRSTSSASSSSSTPDPAQPITKPTEARIMQMAVGGCPAGQSLSNEQIERFGRLKLPANAQSVSAVADSSQGCSVYLTFQIPPAALDPFVATTLIAPPLLPTQQPEGFESLPPTVKWSLPAGKPYLAGQTDESFKEYQWIAVDTSDAAKYVVYVITLVL